jgi:hypothetical protein
LPGVTVCEDGDAERLKLGLTAALTVIVIVVVCVKLPEVPVTVTVTVPVGVALLVVNVSALVPVAGFGLNAAVAPLGNPVADRLTLPVNPFDRVMVIVLDPLLPCVTLTLLGDADRLKSGLGEPPASALISPAPCGLPQPVAKSYPLVAE